MLLPQHSQYPSYGISPVTTTNEQIKENIVYEIMEFQSLIKKNEVMLFGDNQCKVVILLNGESQTQKDKYLKFLLIWGI